MPKRPDKREVVRALALYLRANPRACDSVDGIRRWWLAAHPVTTEDLMEALQWMKDHGLVEELSAIDGRLRYRRCGPEAALQAAIDSPGDDAGTRH